MPFCSKCGDLVKGNECSKCGVAAVGGSHEIVGDGNKGHATSDAYLPSGLGQASGHNQTEERLAAAGGIITGSLRTTSGAPQGGGAGGRLVQATSESGQTQILDGLNCATCGKSIVGNAVQSDSGAHHADCFACVTCRKPIQGPYKIHPTAGTYCQPCYDAEFQARAADQQRREDEVAARNAQRQASHEEWQAGGDETKQPCSVCKQPLGVGQAIRINDEMTHTHCLTCSGCKTPLRRGNEDTIAYKEHAGGVYHSECLAKVVGDVCAGCSEPLRDSFLRVGDAKWHKECFVCGDCSGSLAQGYAQVAGKNLCGTCARKALS